MLRLKHVYIALATTAFVISGCGGCDKINEIKQTAENIKAISNAAEHADEATKIAEQRNEERRKRGDTLAMPYQELQKFLPESISGYNAEEPSGSTVNVNGASYSAAQRNYAQASGADGATSRVTVELIDYNAASAVYAGLTMLWGANFSMEDADKTSRTFNTGIKDVVGFEEFYRKDKNANVTYAIGGRFILSVKADGNQSGTDFAKGIAQSMKIGELAAK